MPPEIRLVADLVDKNDRCVQSVRFRLPQQTHTHDQLVAALSELAALAESTYLRGVAKLDERLFLMLDLARILAENEPADLTA